MEKSKPQKICKFFFKGRCKYGKSCFLKHVKGPKEVDKPCPFFLKGNCKYGESCKYIHENVYSRENKENEDIIKKNENKFNIAKKEKIKKFIDINKLEESLIIFQENKKNLFEGLEYVEFLLKLELKKDIELAQIFRKYQSSFIWIDKKARNFQIKYSPSIKREHIEFLEHEFEEGFLIIDINLNNKNFNLKNAHKDFGYYFNKIVKNLFEKFNENIVKTLREIDNHFDELCKEIWELSFENRKQKKWIQEFQTLLEKSIVKYKEIKDQNEKWEKIASEIPHRTSEECIERFKECRRICLESKNQIKKDAESESEEEDEEEEESNSESEEDGSEDFEEDEHKSENKQEELKNNESSFEEEKKIEYKEETEEEKLLNELRIDLNVNLILDNLKFKNVGVAKITEMYCNLKCIKCRFESELTLRKETEDIIISRVSCMNCLMPSNIAFKSEYFHRNSDFSGRFGTNYWELKEILNLSFRLLCEECDGEDIIENYILGSPIQYKRCRKCFKEMNFGFISYQMVKLDIQEQNAGLKNNNNNDENKLENGNNFQYKKKIVGKFKLNEPLKNNGSCKHCKKSYRMFRFPCCGKAYPCDDCHNDVEKEHDMELAKHMICGFCAQEQAIFDNCCRCGKTLTKTTSSKSHWEGGNGCRNKTTMSKKENKKFSGLSKTLSNRAQRKKH